jgi:Xaa-Pro aminopeptidase
MNKIENTGPNFNLEKFFSARDKALKVLENTYRSLDTGMNYKDIEEVLEGEFKSLQVERLWHPTKIRIGSDTLKTFREHSDNNIKLKDNDIIFFDIGPVIDGHEADVGQTYCFGSNQSYQKISTDVKDIFDRCAEYWDPGKTSGRELYDHAANECDKSGYQLNLSMDGHRLGDWPHAIHYKGSLEEVDEGVSENLWVLELLIRHPNEPFGAFYEDILY